MNSGQSPNESEYGITPATTGQPSIASHENLSNILSLDINVLRFLSSIVDIELFLCTVMFHQIHLHINYLQLYLKIDRLKQEKIKHRFLL